MRNRRGKSSIGEKLAAVGIISGATIGIALIVLYYVAIVAIVVMAAIWVFGKVFG